MTWKRDRERIEALEAIPEIPPLRRGRMPYADPAGRMVEYEGPLRDLGQGIPRPRSRNPLVYRLQRAAWHLALGYASGFPVRAILTFTARNFWPIQDVRDEALVDAFVEEYEPTAEEYAAGGIVGVADEAYLEINGMQIGGGEAYIPLRPDLESRRNRAIIADAARQLEIRTISTSPSCRNGWHSACTRRAFDPIAQKPIWCMCECHPHQEQR